MIKSKQRFVRKHQQGFTLMEVMVALLIVALTIGSGVKIVSNAAINSTRLKDKTFANWVALNQLSELHITKAWPKIGQNDGKSEMVDRQWKWVQKVIKTDDDMMRRVEVSVWPEKDKDADPYVTVVGFIAKP